MLKLSYVAPCVIKISVGSDYYDQFVFNEEEMYDYDLNTYEYTKPDKKALVGREMFMAKILHKYKDKITDFYVRQTGL